MGMEHLDHGRTGHSRTWRGVRLAFALLIAGAFGGLAVQCSSNNGKYVGNGSGNGGSGNGTGNGGSGNGTGNGGTGVGADAGFVIPDSGGSDVTQDAFYLNDPPPANCSDAGVKPPKIGGTLKCPSDKNLPGCPCGSGVKLGDTAACWPGYRTHRNHGDCKDGTTTCELQGENQPVWGPCQGFTGIDPKTYQVITPGSCGCFTHGKWSIDNTSPCFACTDQACSSASGAVSTLKTTQQCPASATTLPSEPWSGDTVSADCTGKFKLCYTLKALSAPNAQQAASDCVMKQVCTEAYYDQANQTQPFPDLGAWVTDTPAEKQCAAAFVSNGGYATMSVDGLSDECEKIQKDFATITYCPLACNNPNPPAICKQCKTGGTGGF